MEEEASTDDLMKEIDALKAKNEQLIGINKRMSEKMDQMEHGKKELLEKMQTDEERRLIERGDFDALVTMKSQQALQAKDDALREIERKFDRADRELEQMKIGSMAREAAIMSGIRPEAQEEVMLMVRDRFKMKDGSLVGFDSTGNELLNSKGEVMGISEYIQSMAPSKSYLFNDAKGAGATGGRSAAAGIKRSDMTMEQKSEFVAKHGQDAFLNLPQ